jgi:NADH-quinone oxidoreductase subunit C
MSMADSKDIQQAAASLTQEQILEKIKSQFKDSVTTVLSPDSSKGSGQAHVIVSRESILEVLSFLRDDPELDFKLLSDVTAVDHLYLELPEIPERYAVVYQLTSFSKGHRIRLKAPVPEDDPKIPSACKLWKAALWGEREAHDMYGIKFEGNPDLRRLLMPANYDGFPLRKDYPLRGRGERESFTQVRGSNAITDSTDSTG